MTYCTPCFCSAMMDQVISPTRYTQLRCTCSTPFIWPTGPRKPSPVSLISTYCQHSIALTALCQTNNKSRSLSRQTHNDSSCQTGKNILCPFTRRHLKRIKMSTFPDFVNLHHHYNFPNTAYQAIFQHAHQHLYYSFDRCPRWPRSGTSRRRAISPSTKVNS
jgi:hypothetical protein